jgi:hypothetical protein
MSCSTGAAFRIGRRVPGVVDWTAILVVWLLPWYHVTVFYVLVICLSVWAAGYLIRSVMPSFRGVAEVLAAQRKPRPVGGDELQHLVIIPAYREDAAILGLTLECLASHAAARRRYHVVLAMEAAEAGATEKAQSLHQRFEARFRCLLWTVHELEPGENPGKSANLRYAVGQARYRLVVDPGAMAPEDLIITVMDSDSLVPEEYFLALAAHYADSPHRMFTLYAAPISFLANADRAAEPVRLIDRMWAIEVLQNLTAGRLIRFPASVYSLGMGLASKVDLWDAGPEAVGEDFHMALKCFFATGGRLRTIPLYYAVDCRHAAGESIGAQLRERYRQTVRHLFGAIDVAYVIDRAVHTPDRMGAKRIAAVFTVLQIHLLPTLSIWCTVAVPSVLAALYLAGRPVAGWFLALYVALLVTNGLGVGLQARAAQRLHQGLGGVAAPRPSPRMAGSAAVMLVLSLVAGISAHTRLLVTDRLPLTVSRKTA